MTPSFPTRRSSVLNAVAVALQPASLAPLLAILASRRLLIAPIIEGDPFRIRSRPIAMPFYSSFAVRVCTGLVVDFTLVDMLAIVATLASQHGFPVFFALPLHASQSTFAIGLVAPLDRKSGVRGNSGTGL